MKSKDIAQKIVAQKAEYTKEDHKATDEFDVDQTVHSCRIINVLGITITFHGKTKKEATDQAVAYFTEQLESGDIVLSDTWAEDNLEA